MKKSNVKDKKDALDNTKSAEILDDVKPTLDSVADKVNSSVDANNKVDAGETKFNPTRIKGKGAIVKQEAIAQAISGNGSGGSGGIQPTMMNAGLRSIPYSGADARIIDNASGTPAFNKSDRSDSRYGQKTDNTARHINYVPSETYTLEYDGPKPLSESPDSFQGSLGHPANEYARIQKCAEAFPGAYDFERSVDEYTDDLILATQGQQLTYEQSGETYDDIDPSKTFDKEAGELIDYSIHRGNYVPRKLHAKYSESGELLDFYYSEDYVDSRSFGDLVSEKANSHTVTAANRAEVDRQAMAAKAGNEVQDDWSPIPFAYPQPTKDVLFLSTIEKQLGANVFVPVKMSAKAHSYQLNKAAKDGMRKESAGVEIALGSVYLKKGSKAYDSFNFDKAENANSVFNRRFTSAGAPSAIIAMMDSIAKYHDRGDLLTQPRSFNMILKQGLSNYKSFKIDPEFARAFDNLNVFSTIDRPYDPSAAVCIQDGFALMNPYSFNELGSCFRTANVYQMVETNLANGSNLALYDLDPEMILTQKSGNNTVQRIPVLETILKDLTSGDIEDYVITKDDIAKCFKVVRQKAAADQGYNMFNSAYAIAFMKRTSGTPSDHVTFVIIDPKRDTDVTLTSFTATWGVSGSDSFTANSFTEVSASLLPYDRKVYNNYLSAQYHNRQNYYYIELRDPYTDGIKTFLRNNAGLLLKVCNDNREISWPIAYTTKTFNAYSYIVMLSLRYMQEQRAKAMLDVLNYSNNFGYPFTDVDDTGSYAALGGTQYGQTDIFELLEVRQMTPAIALRWAYPELYANLEVRRSTPSGMRRVLLPFYFNEDNFEFKESNIQLSHSRASISFPVTKSGIRWSYSDLIYGFSERDVRLLMDQMVVPPCFNGKDTYDNDHSEVYKYSQSSDGLLILECAPITVRQHLATPRELGYVFTTRAGYVTPIADDTSDLTDVVSIDEEMAGYSSQRIICWVNNDGEPQDEILQSGSSIIARAANFTQQYFIYSAFEENPGYDLGVCMSTADMGSLVTGVTTFAPFTNGMWNRGSQTPIDDAPELYSFTKVLWGRVQKLPVALNPFDFGGVKVSSDPYSFNYLMGLVGFRASDYKEDLYNRLTKKMADGWKYVSDPFVEASLLIK